MRRGKNISGILDTKESLLRFIFILVVKVQHDLSGDPSNLTQYRVKLFRNITANLLRCIGHEVSPADDVMSAVTDVSDVDYNLLFTTKSKRVHNTIVIQCAPVVDSTGDRCELSICDYISRREIDMRAMSEHKYWESWREEVIRHLAQASVIIDLIQVKPNSPMKLKIDESVVARRGETNRGGAFILYNCARLASIRKKYEGNVIKGLYPPVPADIDGALFTEPEEWHLLFDYLMEYPILLRRIAENFDKGVIDIHLLCSFTFMLCQSFSVYYRRVRVLLGEKPHLVPTMICRVQLLRAIEKVLEHIFRIFNLSMIEHM